MIQINLLPWREKARQEKQKRFGIVAAGAAGFGLLVTVFFHAHYMSMIKSQQSRNALLQAAVDQSSLDLKGFNDKQRQLNDIEDQLHFIFSLRETSYRAVKILNELAQTSPDAITLNKVVRAGNTIVVYGKAKSNLQITLFMESIEKSKIFKQPVLTEITGKESDAGDERSFQLKLEQQG